MDVHIKMRGEGLNEEYDFLGGEPDREWWLDLAGLVNWNRQGLCVQARSGDWSVYLSPIPSGRQDARGRRREFQLALNGVCGQPTVTAVVLPLLALWLEEVPGAKGTSRLADALCHEFPDEAISRLRGKHTPNHRGETRQRFDAAVENLDLNPSPSACTQPKGVLSEVWWGVHEHAKDRRGFLERVSRLLSGSEEGIAVLGNLVYESDAKNDFADSSSVTRLRAAWPDAAVTLLVRPGRRPPVPARPGSPPVSSSPGGEVGRGKGPAAPTPVTATPKPRTDEQTSQGTDTERLLRRMAWSCAGVAMLFITILVLVVLLIL
ncbi:hypothetical protein ACFT4A_18495 [Streptomyces sp. NPDC057099]|uniref:hypothetical protein n=1 Tax=Streptomyces sp. NPDC057099 TaxID=3346019 RepID=UPI00362CE9C0